MPSTPAQATAEGLPMFSRRNVLSGIIAMPTVAETVTNWNGFAALGPYDETVLFLARRAEDAFQSMRAAAAAKDGKALLRCLQHLTRQADVMSEIPAHHPEAIEAKRRMADFEWIDEAGQKLTLLPALKARLLARAV